MIKLQTTLTLGLCILGSSALGQAQQAIDKAKAIRADFLQTQASHTGKTYAELSKIGWRVSLGKMSIILDAESLELYTYADYDTIGLSQKENLTDQDLVPEGELKATADRIVSLLPPADYADVAITRPNRESGSRHITFLYYPKPFGYSSKGFGNNTSVALDAITGNITYVSRASGWSYQEPNILVTEAEAHQIASEKSGHSEDKVSLVVLKFSLGQSGRLSERILKDKKLRLGYGFSIPNGHIIIDAETGEVLRHDTF